MRSFKTPLLILFLVVISTAKDAFISLTLPSDTLGPIYLPPYYIERGSVSVDADSIDLPPWRYSSLENAIRFESRVDRSTTLKIEYKTPYGELKREYYLFKPTLYDSTNSPFTTAPIASAKLSSEDLYSDQSIEINGEKGVGVSFGQNGEFSMNQNLEVELFGNIDDSTEIIAHISDNSTSLEGDTKEVGALDKIFLTVKSNRWLATAGDVEFKSDTAGVIKLNKSPKGLQAMVKGDWGEINAIGAIDGYRLAFEQFKGVTGIQGGIYRLSGNGEPGVIMPIEGSVEIVVQGVKLTEGDDGDFTVDYSNGEIHFNPSYTIIDDHIIEVKYRYRVYDFTRLTSAISYNLTKESSPIEISALFSVEKDNFNSLDRKLTKPELDSIRASGDRAPTLLSGKKVHPNDVPLEQSRDRLYFLDSSNTHYLYESRRYSSAPTKELFIVNYTVVDSGEGEYLPYNSDNREKFIGYDSLFLDSVELASQDSLFRSPIYLFVGGGTGTHTAYGSAPLPEQNLEGEIRVAFNPIDEVDFSVVVAGRDLDKNSESEVDDGDNLSSGVKGDFTVSSSRSREWIVGARGEALYAGQLFRDDIGDRYTLNREWGLPLDSSGFSTTKGGLFLEKSSLAKLSFDAGIGKINGSNLSHIYSSDFRVTPTEELKGNYNFLLRIGDTSLASSGRRQRFTTGLTKERIVTELLIEEEWLDANSSLNSGYILGEMKLSFPKLNWSNRVEHKRFASGVSDHISAKEDKVHTLWEQSISKSWNRAHQIKLKSSLLNQRESKDTSTSLLIALFKRSNYLEQRYGTTLDYSVNTENSSARRWQYIYVGKGVGTHTKDTITGDFIPDPFGDYIAKEITLWGSESRRSLHNALSYSWIYNLPHSRRGDGLSFSGVLNSQEDVVPSSSGVTTSWIPLMATFKESDDSLTFSNLSYRQDINWTPPKKGRLNSLLSVLLGRREGYNQLIRRVHLTNTISLDRRFLLNSLNTVGLMERRNSYLIKDIRVTPNQTFKVTPIFNLFIEESVGATELDSSGAYYSLKPGASIISKSAGSAQLSYKLGYLNYSGVILYPMADDFVKGFNQRVMLNLNLNIKKRVYFNGFVRMEFNQSKPATIASSIRSTVKF